MNDFFCLFASKVFIKNYYNKTILPALKIMWLIIRYKFNVWLDNKLLWDCQICGYFLTSSSCLYIAKLVSSSPWTIIKYTLVHKGIL